MYIEILFSMAIGLCFFITAVKAYTIGLNHMKTLMQGNTPKLNLDPVKTVVQAVEQHEQKKKEEAVLEELTDIMEYSADTALQAIKKG